MQLKSDLINDAYTEMRISGLTSVPGKEDLAWALKRLEGMANRWREKNIRVDYNFEDQPDPASPTNIPAKFQDAYMYGLAFVLIGAFGKTMHPASMALKRTTYSDMASATSVVRPCLPSERQPIGSGTTLKWGNEWQRFYRTQGDAPNSAATNLKFIGDIDNFVEHFDAYLDDGEAIASFTIEADTGLTILSSAISNNDVDYQLRFDGASNNFNTDQNLQVKIVMTTDAGRVETRIIYFALKDADVIE